MQGVSARALVGTNKYSSNDDGKSFLLLLLLLLLCTTREIHSSNSSRITICDHQFRNASRANMPRPRLCVTCDLWATILHFRLMKENLKAWKHKLKSWISRKTETTADLWSVPLFHRRTSSWQSVSNQTFWTPVRYARARPSRQKYIIVLSHI